jgi:DNA-binding transcriptional LysR family regulator
MFAQLRGKRVVMGAPGTALQSLMLDVLKATDALDASEQSVNLDYAASVDALISGSVDVAIVPAMGNGERTITTPGIRLMSVTQAEAISKTVPGLSASSVLPGPRQRRGPTLRLRRLETPGRAGFLELQRRSDGVALFQGMF